MSFRIFAIAAAVALSSVVPASAEEQPSKPGFVEATWLKRPTRKDLLSVLPVRAAMRGQDGRAVIECEAGVDGLLSKCVVVEEGPGEFGFGNAALLLSPLFRMKPAAQDGQPVPSTVRIPIDWKLNAGFVRADKIGAPASQVTWANAPTRADVDAVRPKALTAAVRVVLNCAFSDDGSLTHCSAQKVEPARYGSVSRAALKLVEKFRANPRPDGRPLKGRILLPIQFDVPGAPEVAPERLLDVPTWSRRPDVEGLPFPEAARAAAARNGAAEVECGVAAQGKLDACRIVSETPGELGFGAAALNAAGLFNVNPWTDEGRPVDGTRVRVAVSYEDTAAAPAAGQ